MGNTTATLHLALRTHPDSGCRGVCSQPRSPTEWRLPARRLAQRHSVPKPFGHEPFGPELMAEGLRAEWRHGTACLTTNGLFWLRPGGCQGLGTAWYSLPRRGEAKTSDPLSPPGERACPPKPVVWRRRVRVRGMSQLSRRFIESLDLELWTRIGTMNRPPHPSRRNGQAARPAPQRRAGLSPGGERRRPAIPYPLRGRGLG